MTRRILLFAGTVIGQIVCLILIAYAWRAIGWQSSLASGLGWLTVLLVCVVNPLLSAYFARRVTRNLGTAWTVNLYILLFSLLLVFVYASESIWLRDSGYMTYLRAPGPGKYANETLAWNQAFNTIEMVISGIVFIVSNIIILKRKNVAVRLVEYRHHRIPIRKVKQLLDYAICPDTDEKVGSLLSTVYSQDDSKLYVFLDDDESPLGIIGYKVQGTSAEILHIAVDEDKRKCGIGRRMIDELLAFGNHLTELTAETDHDAVEFYRRYGFKVESLGEKYPGVERFYCRLLLA